MPLRPTMADFREMNEKGLAEVRKMLVEGRCTKDEADLAFEDYRVVFSIIDSMMSAERENPLKAIDSVSIRRMAQSAGASDQDVIGFLINWHGYEELVAKANYYQKGGRDSV